MKKLLSTTLFTCAVICFGLAQGKFKHQLGTFVDDRDNQEYPTISFDVWIDSLNITKVWMAQNLNYSGSPSYCYKDMPVYCKKYGRLYKYRDAKEACPAGWKIPSAEDWGYLFDYFGGMEVAQKYLIDGKESDMDMLFGGFSDSNLWFKDVGVSGNWWYEGETSYDPYGVIAILKKSYRVQKDRTSQGLNLSIRCVKKND